MFRLVRVVYADDLSFALLQLGVVVHDSLAKSIDGRLGSLFQGEVLLSAEIVGLVVLKLQLARRFVGVDLE